MLVTYSANAYMYYGAGLVPSYFPQKLWTTIYSGGPLDYNHLWRAGVLLIVAQIRRQGVNLYYSLRSSSTRVAGIL